MNSTSESCTPDNCDYWMVSDAARKLRRQASILGAKYINNSTLRLQFNHEISYYSRQIVNNVAQGKKSPEQGLNELKSEQDNLLSQALEMAQKGVGVIAGALQFAAGAGICYGSAGTLCFFAGAPLMAHGANNTYENGRNLWAGRSNVQGPVRKAYQKAAEMMGGGAFEGNVAYASVDLALSAYSLSKLMLKPDAWRLFRYVRSDYVRGYENSSKAALALEAISDTTTVNSLYLETQSGDR
ncbi:DUF4225 domain-containing protein [Pseudomonas guariconensis]|uniref:DUF4225 domain-containing protein n=1 Tax=Pseudomonas guariconensis TaxID=1288410 RepID=UPI001E534C3A|nr:DUF4225 domain-containing protein [Pseudomonas guariconensis]